MSATLHFDPATSLCEVRIRGTLKRSEFTSCEDELAARISAGERPRMLVGAGTKEADVRAFSGADLRPTPVRFFPADELAVAKSWVLE